METVEASLEHVAVGCNVASNALAAFAAQNVVCVLRCTHDKESNGVPLTISETLKHQEAAVTDSSRLTSVRLQMDAQSEPQVLAGDSEGRRLYVVAFSDGTLVAFAEATEGGEVTLMSRLDLGVKSIMEAVEAMVMVSEDGQGEESVLVAAGGVDAKVHLFEVAGGEDTLTPLLELEGHRGWIRSLAFQQLERKEGVSVVLLASASQDQRIRLWKITARSKIDTPGSSGEVKDGYLAVGEQMTYIWTQLPTGDSVGACEPALLSSSMDNTLIVWTKPTDARGSWTPSLRVGEMGGNGLLSGGVLPARGDRLNLVSLNFGGQLERWEQQPAPSKLFQPAISFVSGADEKILRVFEAPDEVKQLIELSLTNKSAEEEEPTGASESSNRYANLKDSLSLPVGDRLGRKTLWPEQRKLYGHGNEMLCVTSSHSGDLIASACKSREERYAAVRLWNTSDWSEAQEPLEGHKSSVVQLEFSPNDQFLLSVSRDRQFCLYQRQQSSDKKFALVEHVKAHRRIIWSCSWSPDSIQRECR
uniref:Elongator complex protein 2 n=1 Tax=Phytophthora ramorum TaxID=164328 RepID=H3HD18_PHYRM